MTQLLTPIRIGRTLAPNRLVMAPMTRSRADADGVPSDLSVTYYAQRASAGLIITEGVFPSAMDKGYVHTPGIETAAQVAAWKKVTEAVHAKGGRIHAIDALRPGLSSFAAGRRNAGGAFGHQAGRSGVDPGRPGRLRDAA